MKSFFVFEIISTFGLFSGRLLFLADFFWSRKILDGPVFRVAKNCVYLSILNFLSNNYSRFIHVDKKGFFRLYSGPLHGIYLSAVLF